MTQRKIIMRNDRNKEMGYKPSKFIGRHKCARKGLSETQFEKKKQFMRVHIFIIFLMHSPILFAQLEDKPPSDTYVILKDSSVVFGSIKTPRNIPSVYNKIVFIDQNGVNTKYSPEELKGFHWKSTDYLSNDTFFVRIVVTGPKLSLYEYTELQRAGSEIGYYSATFEQTTYYLKRPDDVDLMLVKSRKFKKVYSAYFKDCPKLSDRIRNKKLRHDNMSTIVTYYNKFCNAKK